MIKLITYTYHAAKGTSNCLNTLWSNECTIKDTQVLAAETKSLPPLNDDEEDVFYDAQSLFTKVPVKNIINYLTDQIYKK